MDNLTHSLAGWALGQAGLKRKTRKGLAALVLGANAPDIDVFFGWVPWAPLATHRGITHSLIAGLWVLPLLLAALLWLFDRWQVRRGKSFVDAPEMHFGWLLALSFIGCLTHPLLDWQTVYAIQLFSPLDTRWFHADSLFIVDVWIILALGVAIWLSRRRAGWTRPPQLALCGIAAYIAANAGLSSLALAAPRVDRPYANPDAIAASPPPVLFWRRDVVWRQDHGIWRGHYDPFRSLLSLNNYSGPVPDGMADPLAQRVLRDTPGLRNFRRWSIMPIARVERGRCQDIIHYADARFSQRAGSGPMASSVAIRRGAPGC